MLPVLLVVNVHEGSVPDPGTWLPAVSLSDGLVRVSPQASYRTVFQSEHHQTLVLQFPASAAGQAIDMGDPGELRLTMPDVVSGGPALSVAWSLPLAYPSASLLGGPAGSVAALASILAVMAGLLVVFSPCAVHMTAYFLPIVTGLGLKEISERHGDVRFRAHVALSGLAFVAGFVLLYTTFGVAAGLAGQFFSNTTQLEPILLPIRIITGAVVIYVAIQTLGFFRMPFVIALRLPGRPHRVATPRQGYVAAAIAGMSISFGCLVCVGGTLLAALLVYAGTSGSPLVGGLTLFLFALGMALPFLLVAVAFDRVLPRIRAMRSVLQYSTSVAGAMMLVLGLLILSGNDSIFERLFV
jgi:cytochrome c-type biogenesis protein